MIVLVDATACICLEVISNLIFDHYQQVRVAFKENMRVISLSAISIITLSKDGL